MCIYTLGALYFVLGALGLRKFSNAWSFRFVHPVNTQGEDRSTSHALGTTGFPYASVSKAEGVHACKQYGTT